jgi:hypothetical protein
MSISVFRLVENLLRSEYYGVGPIDKNKPLLVFKYDKNECGAQNIFLIVFDKGNSDEKIMVNLKPLGL